MIGYRIEPVEGFNAISMHTPPVYDAPFGCRKANDLRGLGVLNGSLDIDFQGVEAKINIPYNTVYDGDCAVMLRPGDGIDCEGLVLLQFLMGAARSNECQREDEDYRPHSSCSF